MAASMTALNAAEPARISGLIGIDSLRNSAGRLRSTLAMLVRTTPGQRTETLTRDFRCSRLVYMLSESATTACLVTAYGEEPPPKTSPAAEDVLTMWHSVFCSSIRGVNTLTP